MTMLNQDDAPATKGDIRNIKDIIANIEARMATKEDLKGFPTKEYFKGFATKDDLAETRRALSLQLVDLQSEVREIKATMSTKADTERIISLLDAFAGKTEGYDRAKTLHGHVLTEVQVSLKDHDRRLKRLESKPRRLS